jgi:hypothetical protein
MKMDTKKTPKLVAFGSARRETKGIMGNNHEIDGVRPHL